ncbi:MAG: helix-turn-helix domain-containing protein [Clostridiales bacterium]|nr:helix-turn-helix domain-containing protein [Clostridiales bacterium]
MEDMKQIIADNLVAYRKQAQMTQQELADKLNYSDKAVSKWERAEGIPDVLVLKALADLYGVTVNDFLVEHTKRKRLRFKDFWAKRWLITLLSAGLVYFIATIVVFVWLVVDPASAASVAKYTYLTAAPISLIVVLVFCCMWGKLWQRCVVASALIWTLCLLIHLALNIIASEYTWMIYVVGAAMQLLVILWYILVYFVKRGKTIK